MNLSFVKIPKVTWRTSKYRKPFDVRLSFYKNFKLIMSPLKLVAYIFNVETSRPTIHLIYKKNTREKKIKENENMQHAFAQQLSPSFH